VKSIIIVLLALVLSAVVHKDKCDQLTDGTYSVQYDDQYRKTHRDFKLVIKGGKAVAIRPNEKSSYGLKWVGENRFRLIKRGKKPDTLDPLQKQLRSLGEPYYEITECKPDTLWFTFYQNPHVVINSGVLIKEKIKYIRPRRTGP
jgi:hypothetical protein